jgi:MFS superfamily sulfate permease-like transporter
VLVDSESIASVDTSAVDMLVQLQSDLSESGVTLAYAGVRTEVQAVLERGGVVDALGREHFHLSVRSGVEGLSKELHLASPEVEADTP